jgi:hypothetical protein
MVYGATWAWRQGDTAAGEGDAAVNAGRLGGSCERLGGGIIAGWCARIDLPALVDRTSADYGQNACIRLNLATYSEKPAK